MSPARRRVEGAASPEVSLKLAPLTLVVALLAVAVPAAAQPLAPQTGAETPRPRLDLSLTGNKIREDWFLRVGVSARIVIPDVPMSGDGDLFERPQRHDLRLHLYAPFTVLLKDNAPESEDRFRTAEWDEPSEYLRLIRSAEYGTPYDGLYWRAGELSNVRIGHRSIVDNYINTLEVDRFQWGLHANVNTVHGGTETLIDNVTRPELIGTRLYVRPWSFIDPSSVAYRLAFGVSLFGDVRAPAALAAAPDGRYLVDDDGEFIVERRDATGVLGFDVEMTAVQTDRVSLTPYTDVNIHLGQGAGWHLGTFFGAAVTDTVVADLRAEYRLLGRNYLPTYFGPLYEIERFAYLPVDDSPTRLPRLQWLRTGQEDSVRHGWLVELGLNVADIVRVAASLADHGGDNNTSAWIYVAVTAVQRVQLAAWYANTRFQGARNLFDLDNALATVEARVMLTQWLFVTGQLNRRWQLDTDGDYQPIDDFAVGAGASFSF